MEFVEELCLHFYNVNIKNKSQLGENRPAHLRLRYAMQGIDTLRYCIALHVIYLYISMAPAAAEQLDRYKL